MKQLNWSKRQDSYLKNPESSAKIVGAVLTPEPHATVGAFYQKKKKKTKGGKKKEQQSYMYANLSFLVQTWMNSNSNLKMSNAQNQYLS